MKKLAYTLMSLLVVVGGNSTVAAFDFVYEDASPSRSAAGVGQLEANGKGRKVASRKAPLRRGEGSMAGDEAPPRFAGQKKMVIDEGGDAQRGESAMTATAAKPRFAGQKKMALPTE